jgi:methylmalonyl-CoA mutase cobalamin-binding domain/chain
MANEQRTREILNGLQDAVVSMDENAVKELSEMALEEGIDAYYAVSEGLTKAMDRVGELYSNKEYFVPEILLASDALYAGLAILQPHIKIRTGAEKKSLLLGVVEGDVHDIGKNLVKIMFEAAGWDVRDLGVDVKLSIFGEEQAKKKADIVGISALMTTSMLAIPKAIELVKAGDPDVAILVGGAPLNRELASRYGADGYANCAGEVVKEAQAMIERVKNRKKVL